MPSEMPHLEGSLAEQCRTFSKFLNLEQPVPEKVLLAAVENPTYAKDLLLARPNPPLLKELVQYPPDIQKQHSNLELIGRVSKALIRWGATGFKPVNQHRLERRENACLACPHLRDPVKKLQKLAGTKVQADQIGQRLGNKVCGICGCAMSRKIRLPREVCPDQHPTRIGFTRWEEPIV